ncbi:type II secretion system protein [Desulfonatronovibrio hydrogenovorans]|uniref:type II secretion system protein n=1 Tax=Desulfonatronovibrio hydrogenovorans TaxID=53245 RepID=UPI00048B7AEB|nr:prepilin-type N-terminal cleavage/methylation domain-containing protein [Desulfonatronovibrio hydrogenovorans]
MKPNGFTFLELLIVMGIMILVAAMIWPMHKTLDDTQRYKITMKKIQEIEDAILGHSEIVDSYDLDRSVGGYVRDMCQGQNLSQPDEWCDWPGLWEPEGEEDLGGIRGFFDNGRFTWNSFKKVADPGKESMGQPRGLWTRQLNTESISSQRWQGPYIKAPVTTNPALGRHFADNQDQYADLYVHDREYFHLLQGQDQLVDGWNRAFRFFLTNQGETFWIVSLGPDGQADFPADFKNYDPDLPLNRDNIVHSLRFDRSEWQNILASQRVRSRTVERLIVMTGDYMDRLVQALVGDSPAGPNTGYTGDMLAWPDLWNYVCRFESGVPGDPGPVPCGTCRNEEGETVVCGTLEAVHEAQGWWENKWEDPDFGGNSDYTYGQPRGLWDQDDLDGSEFGVGWRHAYHPKPENSSGSSDVRDRNEVLRDAWDRPLHFFKVEENGKEHLMIVSTGESGSGVFHINGNEFIFPQPEFADDPVTGFSDYLEKRTEPFNLAEYQPGFTGEIDGISHDNTDNIVRLVRLDDWKPGFMNLLVSLDADLNGVSQVDCNSHVHESNDFSCRVYGLDGSPVFAEESFQTRWDEEEDLCRVDSLHFKFDDKTVTRIIMSGGRYLVCWDSNQRNPGAEKLEPDTDDWNRIFSVFASPARIVDREILLKVSNF